MMRHLRAACRGSSSPATIRRARLTTFRERWRLLQTDGPDVLCVLRFSERLRNAAARRIRGSCWSAAGIRQLVIGHDFRAARDGRGHRASGSGAKGRDLGLDVEVVPPVLDAGAADQQPGGARRRWRAATCDARRDAAGPALFDARAG